MYKEFQIDARHSPRNNAYTYIKYTEFYNISDFKVLRFQQDFKEVVQDFKAVADLLETVNIRREKIAINSTEPTASAWRLRCRLHVANFHTFDHNRRHTRG